MVLKKRPEKSLLPILLVLAPHARSNASASRVAWMLRGSKKVLRPDIPFSCTTWAELAELGELREANNRCAVVPSQTKPEQDEQKHSSQETSAASSIRLYPKNVRKFI